MSARERQVLRLIARGLTNAQIGSDLFIEEDTVKTYVRRILAKLGAGSRAGAVGAGYETGLLRTHAGALALSAAPLLAAYPRCVLHPRAVHLGCPECSRWFTARQIAAQLGAGATGWSG